MSSAKWCPCCSGLKMLTHWGRVRHICISNLTSVGSDNGLLPGRCQAIIWTNAGLLFIGPLGTNFSEISIEIHTFPFKKIHLKILSAKWRPSCLALSVLKEPVLGVYIVICYYVIQLWIMFLSYNLRQVIFDILCRTNKMEINTGLSLFICAKYMPSNIWYKVHQIQKLKRF